jgi:predicted XRE-type DNA-binding protein
MKGTNKLNSFINQENGVMTSEEKDFTGSSDNIYADLGIPDADDMLLKAEIVSEIASTIRERELTQAEAAKLLGINQPKVSQLLRGSFESYTIDRLIRLLGKLNTRISITFHRQAEPGKNVRQKCQSA